MKSGPKEGEVWLEFHRGSMFKDEGQKGLKESGRATDAEVTL